MPKNKITWMLLKTFVIAFMIIFLIRIFIGEIYQVNGVSMQGELYPGDKVFVSKIDYGPRIPRILKIPFLSVDNLVVRFSGLPISTPNVIPYFRLPGSNKVSHGDIILFNAPFGTNNSHELNEVLLKRCVGLPGDNIKIDHNNLYINGLKQQWPDHAQFTYQVTCMNQLSEVDFSRVGIHDIKNQIKIINEPSLEGGTKYVIHASLATISNLRNFPGVTKLNPIEASASFIDLDLFPHNPRLQWNINHYGELVVPKKGMCVELNLDNLAYYFKIIRDNEGFKNVSLSNDSLFINEEFIKNYTFKNNYFFALGDNLYSSFDSRYWGFIPETHLIGKARFIWYPAKGMKEWNKIFKKL